MKIVHQISHVILGLIVAASCVATPASAASERPVPYWASIRADPVNLRVGPGESYRIAWVYQRKQMPVKVIRLMDGWRLIEDVDGTQGWMLSRFLTPARTAVVRSGPKVEMRAQGNAQARVLWHVEPYVSAALGKCEAGWCHVTIGRYEGYILEGRLWGAGAP